MNTKLNGHRSIVNITMTRAKIYLECGLLSFPLS